MSWTSVVYSVAFLVVALFALGFFASIVSDWSALLVSSLTGSAVFLVRLGLISIASTTSGYSFLAFKACSDFGGLPLLFLTGASSVSSSPSVSFFLAKFRIYIPFVKTESFLISG